MGIHQCLKVHSRDLFLYRPVYPQAWVQRFAGFPDQQLLFMPALQDPFWKFARSSLGTEPYKSALKLAHDFLKTKAVKGWQKQFQAMGVGQGPFQRFWV